MNMCPEKKLFIVAHMKRLMSKLKFRNKGNLRNVAFQSLC